MPIIKEYKSPSETATRTGIDYVKLTSDQRTVLRFIPEHEEAVEAWKHFIKVANGGKGWGLVCPGRAVCPSEASVSDLPKDDKDRKDAQARIKFIINVLDRTPHTICPKCDTKTAGRRCSSCKNDLRGLDFEPLNKIKVFESGPQIFRSLAALEKMQEEELEKKLSEYDITFTSMGEMRERQTNVAPQPDVPFNDAWLLDPTTGEPQKLFDLELLKEPAMIEEVEVAMRGGSAEEILAVRGVPVGA